MSLPRARLAPLLAAPVLALLVACGTPGVSPTPSPTLAPPVSAAPTLDVAALDPCAVFDRSELSSAVHADLPEGERLPDAAGHAVCRWDAPSASTRVTVLTSRIAVEDVGDEPTAEQLPPDSGGQEMHGVGDLAWFNYCPVCPEEDATTLTVIAIPLQFSISLVLPTTDDGRQIILEQLARAAIDRLGL